MPPKTGPAVRVHAGRRRRITELAGKAGATCGIAPEDIGGVRGPMTIEVLQP